MYFAEIHHGLLPIGKSNWVNAYLQCIQQCVVPENIHTSPTDGFSPLSPPTPSEIPVKLHNFLSTVWPLRPPTSSELPVTIHGESMDIFWNHTIMTLLT